MDNKSPEAFRTISEVAEWLGVPTHVLRFWESRFGQVRPVKRAGGRRYYRPSDMELLGGIRKLLHDDGMTIRGVQKLLREKGVKHVAALSPPIDQPAALKTVDDVAVFESGEAERPVEAAQAPVFADPVEDAELVADQAAEADGPRFDEAPAPTDGAPGDRGDDADTAGPRNDTGAGRPPADTAHEPEMFAAEAQAMPAAEDTTTLFAPQAGAPDDTAQEAALGDDIREGEEARAEEPEDEEPEDEALALPDPTEMEFLAHGAVPDTHESDAAQEPGVAPAPDEPLAAEPVTRPPTADAAPSSPALVWEEVPEHALDTATAPAEGEEASAIEMQALVADEVGLGDAEEPGAAAPEAPETEDAPAPPEPPAQVPHPDDLQALGPDRAGVPDAASSELPQTDEPEAAPNEAIAAPAMAMDVAAVPPAPAAPREPAATVLTMPEIGPDPEDNAVFDLLPTLPGRLRHFRADGAGTGLNIAALRAYADRLEALSQRVGLAPDDRRPF